MDRLRATHRKKKRLFRSSRISGKLGDGASDRCRKRRCRFIYQRFKVPFALVWPAEWIQWIVHGVSDNVQCPMALQWSPMAICVNVKIKAEGLFVLGMHESACGLYMYVCLAILLCWTYIMRWQGRRSHQPKLTKCSERRTGQDTTSSATTVPGWPPPNFTRASDRDLSCCSH